MNDQKKVLVFGATGMLGHTLFRYFSEKNIYNTFGTIRSNNQFEFFSKKLGKKLITGIDIENLDLVKKVLNNFNPDIVVNCVGLIKQLPVSRDPIRMISINSLFPNYLANLCNAINSRLIHLSTDCVFSGHKGMYTEKDFPDGNDLYAQSKYLGEVNSPNTVNIRTSLIGHEIKNSLSLLEWFLAQKEEVRGYSGAIFSGLPTVEMSRVIHDYVIPYDKLQGICNISAEPISKYDLLKLIAKVYNKSINIIPDDIVKANYSLDSNSFRLSTGYCPPKWDELIKAMRSYG